MFRVEKENYNKSTVYYDTSLKLCIWLVRFLSRKTIIFQQLYLALARILCVLKILLFLISFCERITAKCFMTRLTYNMENKCKTFTEMRNLTEIDSPK